MAWAMIFGRLRHPPPSTACLRCEGYRANAPAAPPTPQFVRGIAAAQVCEPICTLFPPHPQTVLSHNILCSSPSAVHTQAHGGVEDYDDGEEWQVSEIEALVPRGGDIVAYVGWTGYNRVYNTFEPLVNIVDRTLVTKFQEQNTDLIAQALWSMRDEVAATLLKQRYVYSGLEVPVPAAAHSEVARALLARWSRPPSRAGKAAIKLEVSDGATVRTTQLQLDLLNDIAWLLKLELARPEKMFGCVVVRRGKTSNGGMLVFGPPFVVTCALTRAPLCLRLSHPGLCPLRFTEPIPREDAAFVPGRRCFTISGNAWLLNGYYGTLVDIPGAPNASMRKPIAEHVKAVLRGRAPWGLRHRLTKTWAQLPSGKLELSADAAMPKRRGAKRARSGPSALGEAPPQMGAL